MHSKLFHLVFGLAVANVAFTAPPAQIPLREHTPSFRTELQLVKRNAAPTLVTTCGMRGAGNDEGLSCDPKAEKGGHCCSTWGYCVCLLHPDNVFR